jgi:hypothetical protein
MASSRSRATTGATDGDGDRDRLIAEAEAAEVEHGAASRTLFDLRMIIGVVFLCYGVYLTIRGLTDGQAALDQAAGVRINLWTGLFGLALGGGFVAWALLRPLRLEELAEAQPADADGDRGH